MNENWRQNAKQIEAVEKWLEAGKNSISKYVGVSQIVLQLEGDEDSSSQSFNLANAAYNQYQAEECYRHYVQQLQRCELKDRKCLKAYRSLESQCAIFGNTAQLLLSNAGIKGVKKPGKDEL